MSIKVIAPDCTVEIEAQPDVDLLTAIRKAGLTVPGAACGGKSKCRKCWVMADGKKVLSCETKCQGVKEVTILEPEEINAVTKGASDIAGGGTGLGLAVDIGTTTVASFLYDLESGKQLAKAGTRNAQRSYGADVISRIQAWDEGHGDELCGVIRRQISDMTDELCTIARKERSQITFVSIVGNTVMEHIADNLSPVGIGVAPFTPESLFGDIRPAEGFLDGLFPGAQIYMAPAMAGYVGGDITAGLFASGGLYAEGLWFYIDIGTNGEMCLGNKDGWISCATAAGPAFEGAEISCGMDGSAGAIDKVKPVNGDLECHVIGEGEAKGLCGSGLIDAVSSLLTIEELSEAGRLDTSPRPLKDGVTICADDVRQVQLAKAAIRAGAETLLEISGHKAEEITQLVIAGGFGSYMDAASALHIGLLPNVPLEKISHVGNAAGAGAALGLTKEGREAIAELNGKCKYFELSGSALFRDYYVDCMAFDTDDD